MMAKIASITSRESTSRGVCIAEEVLGRDILEVLWKSEAQRTLRIHVPWTPEENSFAAVLACVPWEMARPALDSKTLAERNVLNVIV